MRVGQNPAKFVDTVVQPQEITVAVITCIPMLSGFYEQSLDVLKACLSSILANTEIPFDLMVFDNASCPEVREYLRAAHEEGIIQYLVLLEKNIGKMGAWNFIFGAAPGKYLAYADSDIYFQPDWLSQSLDLLEALPNVG
ncbi:MAG: glycosyltransferase family A protein, partial [Anaerolineales bacterium]